MNTPMKAAMVLAVLAGPAMATPALAQSADAMRVGIRAGDVLLRVRAITVVPNEDSGGITPAFPNERLAVGNAVMPEVDATYMATDHLGFELIASTTKHSAKGTSGTTGRIGTLATTWVLPPTLTAQYHFTPTAHVRPYLGAGINYTVFWNEKASDGLQAAVGRTHVGMKDSIGWAAQAGVDVDITPKLFLNLDVKYIDMGTIVRLDTAAAGTQQVKLDLNPLVFGVGMGLRL
ncbi:MAG TPA: OmpW family outer membrane protein [Sphingomonas sanguinis]|uniref:OmpW/AlkL family protein n=1 Tax=Sphingomonas sanguinis TaxID=33051 RepID=UPI002AC0941A|nr:OmpW family outer membrane protein [Sphingomonas sanguinis]HJO66719.1 OmpW family outer membrane protein [Sphingomonas sanguinis]